MERCLTRAVRRSSKTAWRRLLTRSCNVSSCPKPLPATLMQTQFAMCCCKPIRSAMPDVAPPFPGVIYQLGRGAVWSRPGLDRRTRRLLVLAITAALARWEEFTLHLRAGLADDLEPSDVKESILQAAIYAGVPAANTAFKIA